MKMKKFLGIDIGNYSIKCCLMNSGNIENYFVTPLPEGMVHEGRIVQWDSCGEFIRDELKAHNIRCKDLFMVVPRRACFLRFLTVPVMNVQQLRLNLPYEFRDYITDQTEEYFFDYGVLERDEKEMHIMAAAMRKGLIEQYRSMAKRAGLRLRVLLPQPLCYQRLFQALPEENRQKDYAILNIGEEALEISFLKRGFYETTRDITPGLEELIERTAELSDLAPMVLRQRLDSAEYIDFQRPELEESYTEAAVQIMRVMNFYSFNNPKNTIDAIYYFGDGVHLLPLLEAIERQVELPIRPITALFPNIREDMQEAAMVEPEGWGLTLYDEKEGSRSMKPEKSKGIPAKSLLNLCYAEKDTKHYAQSLGVFAVYLVLLAIFAQVFVYGQLRKADRAEAVYTAQETALEAIQQANEVYAEVRAQYSHYGNGYLNADEKAIPDRIQLVDTIDRCVSSYGSIQSLQVSGREASVSLQMSDGAHLSDILAALEAEENVSYTQASMSQTQESQSYVNAEITIYFKSEDEIAAARESAEAESGTNGEEAEAAESDAAESGSEG